MVMLVQLQSSRFLHKLHFNALPPIKPFFPNLSTPSQLPSLPHPGMAMGIGPDPNSWISIRFHGFGSEKYRPVIFGSDPDPFKFHGSESGSEKNTQTRTRESGGPVLFIFYFFYIKYILKLEFGERVLGIWEEHEYMMNILIFICLLFRLFFLTYRFGFFFPFLFAI